MDAYRDLSAAYARIQELEDDINRRAKRIYYLERRLQSLLRGKWLARLFGYKAYVNCEHSKYCHSYESMASAIANDKVPVLDQREIGSYDARHEHCRICGARFGQCSHVNPEFTPPYAHCRKYHENRKSVCIDCGSRRICHEDLSDQQQQMQQVSRCNKLDSTIPCAECKTKTCM